MPSLHDLLPPVMRKLIQAGDLIGSRPHDKNRERTEMQTDRDETLFPGPDNEHREKKDRAKKNGICMHGHFTFICKALNSKRYSTRTHSIHIYMNHTSDYYYPRAGQPSGTTVYILASSIVLVCVSSSTVYVTRKVRTRVWSYARARPSSIDVQQSIGPQIQTV